MPEGSTFMVALYYRENMTNMVPVAMTNITHTKNVFPTTTHLVDFQVRVPPVKATDALAGKHIGIQLLATATQPGGYWDLDNVRLTATAGSVPPEFSLTAEPAQGGLKLSWPSAAGWKYQVKSSDNLNAWTDRGSPLDGTGQVLSQVLPMNSVTGEFFSVVASPAP
jgi:hypothetical protein